MMNNDNNKQERTIRRYNNKYNGWNIEIGSTVPELRQVYYIKILKNVIVQTDTLDSQQLKREINHLIKKHILSITTLHKKKHIEVIKLLDDWERIKYNTKTDINSWTKTTISMEIHLMRNEQYPNKMIKYYTNPKTGVKQKRIYTSRDYLLLFVDEIKTHVENYINELNILIDRYNTNLNCYMGIDLGTGQDKTAIAIFNSDKIKLVDILEN